MSADFSPRELIRRCSEGDRRGWEEFWELVEMKVMGEFRRLLRSRQIDPTLADDLRQAFCLFLLEEGGGLLGTFRGSSVAQLRAFVGRVAWHFADHRLLSWRRARAREAEALLALTPPPHAGPTESAYYFAVTQLVSLMAEPDRARMAAVLAMTIDSPVDRPERTLRRWSEVLRRYVDRVDWVGGAN
jgi:DNA-directed RNA polymerase specialized sigma24 family protein